jgi:hypothetical protein
MARETAKKKSRKSGSQGKTGRKIRPIRQEEELPESRANLDDVVICRKA